MVMDEHYSQGSFYVAVELQGTWPFLSMAVLYERSARVGSMQTMLPMSDRTKVATGPTS